MASITDEEAGVDAHGHRKFYDFEFVDKALHQLINAHEDTKPGSAKLIDFIRDSIIGTSYTFQCPYGLRKGKRATRLRQ